MKLNFLFVQVGLCLLLLVTLAEQRRDGNEGWHRKTTPTTTTMTSTTSTTSKPTTTTSTTSKPTTTTSTTSKPTTTTSTTSKPTATTSTTSKSTTTTSTTNTPTTATSPPFKCPTLNNSGVYADPADCTHYYVCTNGVAINQACGPALSVFDPNMGRCRLPVFIPSCIVGK